MANETIEIPNNIINNDTFFTEEELKFLQSHISIEDILKAIERIKEKIDKGEDLLKEWEEIIYGKED